MSIYFWYFLFKFLCYNSLYFDSNSYTYVDNNILSLAVNIDDYEIIPTENLEIQVGKLSRYGPDCYGCSGILAHGEWVLNGKIYYEDAEYGSVRILAADRGYPFGTMVRITTNDSIFLGIVLDRGSAIGFNKIALFDLLYPSEELANIDGISYNTTFEILRYGF